MNREKEQVQIFYLDSDKDSLQFEADNTYLARLKLVCNGYLRKKFINKYNVFNNINCNDIANIIQNYIKPRLCYQISFKDMKNKDNNSNDDNEIEGNCDYYRCIYLNDTITNKYDQFVIQFIENDCNKLDYQFMIGLIGFNVKNIIDNDDDDIDYISNINNDNRQILSYFYKNYIFANNSNKPRKCARMFDSGENKCDFIEFKFKMNNIDEMNEISNNINHNNFKVQHGEFKNLTKRYVLFDNDINYNDINQTKDEIYNPFCFNYENSDTISIQFTCDVKTIGALKNHDLLVGSQCSDQELIDAGFVNGKISLKQGFIYFPYFKSVSCQCKNSVCGFKFNMRLI